MNKNHPIATIPSMIKICNSSDRFKIARSIDRSIDRKMSTKCPQNWLRDRLVDVIYQPLIFIGYQNSWKYASKQLQSSFSQFKHLPWKKSQPNVSIPSANHHISSWHCTSFEAESYGYRAIESLYMYQRHFLSDWNIDPKYVSSRPQWMSIHVVVVWNPTPLSPRCHFDGSLGFLFTLIAHRYFLLRDHRTYSL